MAQEKMPNCIFYYYIHFNLYEKYGDKEISIKEAKNFLFEWRIKKPVRPIIIKELEILGLVEKINKRLIKLKKPEYDPDRIGEYYKEVGLY